MNRLQKRCLVLSVATHLLLAVVLFVGPGFLPSQPPPVNDLPIINVVVLPDILTDEKVFGGGEPGPPPAPAPPAAAKAVEPAPAPAPKPPAPTPPPAREEPPKVEPKKPDKAADIPDPEAVEPPKEIKPKRTLSNQELKAVKRPRKSVEDTQAAAAAAEERAAADREREIKQALAARQSLTKGVLSNIKGSLSGSVAIKVGTGSGVGGTGGPTYANYDQVIKSLFDQAWYDPPREANSGSLQVEVVVAITRNGNVVSARIVRPSGNEALDRSVRRALDRVPSVPAFPAGAKEDQRTYTIVFDLNLKNKS